LELGKILHHEWWKLINNDERALGFGWVNYENDEFEISLVVDSNYQGLGLGSFIMENLETLALEKGFFETVARVKESNPNSEEMIVWLYKKNYVNYWVGMNGFEPKSLEFASRIVKKQDVKLIKKII
jgi:GNAT superfamily N-acetyltransferase